MKHHKVEAQGDTMYIKAATLAEAQDHFDAVMGIPSSMVTWTEDVDLPEGEVSMSFEAIYK